MSARTAVAGQVLVQVLVMAVLLVLLAAVMMRTMLQQATIGSRAVGRTEAKAKADAAVDAVRSAWAAGNGTNCSDHVWDAGNQVDCTNTPGECRSGGSNCNCAVTINGQAYPSVSASWQSLPSPGYCKLSVAILGY